MLQAGAARAARELAALQSLFKQAVIDNRELAVQLQVCRAQLAQLDVAAAVGAPPPTAQYREQALPPAHYSQPEPPQPRYPIIYTQQQQQPCSSEPQAERQAAAAMTGSDHLRHVKRALALQLQQQQASLPPAESEDSEVAAEPVPPPSHYTAISVTAAGPPISSIAPPPAAPPSQPAPQPPPTAPQTTADLQQVFSELQALQQRLQAAEQRLLLQAPQQAQPEYPAEPSPDGGSRPGSTCAAAPRPVSRSGTHQEHRESWQLIRQLKQRRAKLEAERLATASAALAGNSLRQAAGSSAPAPASGAVASGARANAWLFDTRDLPPTASLLQPVPRKAAAARPGSDTCGWGQQQPGRGRAAASVSRGRSREQSTMTWQAAGQRLPGTAGGGSARGRRASLSAVSETTLPAGQRAIWQGAVDGT